MDDNRDHLEAQHAHAVHCAIGLREWAAEEDVSGRPERADALIDSARVYAAHARRLSCPRRRAA